MSSDIGSTVSTTGTNSPLAKSGKAFSLKSGMVRVVNAGLVEILIDSNCMLSMPVDESNLAKLDSYNLFNLRIGMEWENLMAELFVMNLTDEEAWQTGARWTDFSSPSQFAFLTAKQGVAVSPLDKREVGLRVNWKF
jgi:outer membrane receptor protein involved in Fe transport